MTTSHPLQPAPISSNQGHTLRDASDDGLARAQQASVSSHQMSDEDTKVASDVFGTLPCGIIGKHKPREVVRIDRDYSQGELPQFWSGFPTELEGRVTPVQHLNLLNELNSLLASANDPHKSIFDNVLAVLTFYVSTVCYRSHYQREMQRLAEAIERANRTAYNPVGLNVLDPRRTALLFLEIEYY